MHYLRLSCTEFWVDARVSGINGRWLASADTPDGPSIGLGWTPSQALTRRPRAIDGLVENWHELLPRELFEHGAIAGCRSTHPFTAGGDGSRWLPRPDTVGELRIFTVGGPVGDGYIRQLGGVAEGDSPSGRLPGASALPGTRPSARAGDASRSPSWRWSRCQGARRPPEVDD